MKHPVILILLLGSLLLTACGSESGSEPASQNPPAAQEQPEAEPLPPLYAEGRTAYHSLCAPCHMRNGSGAPGLNPPLRNTDWVMGDKERLIGVMLNGLNEEIEIDGEFYNNQMASFAYLDDQQIAAILTFVRHEFGRKASPISTEEVAAARAVNEPAG